MVRAQHIQHFFWCFPRSALQLEIHTNTCIEDGIPFLAKEPPAMIWHSHFLPMFLYNLQGHSKLPHLSRMPTDHQSHCKIAYGSRASELRTVEAWHNGATAHFMFLGLKVLPHDHSRSHLPIMPRIPFTSKPPELTTKSGRGMAATEVPQ